MRWKMKFVQKLTAELKALHIQNLQLVEAVRQFAWMIEDCEEHQYPAHEILEMFQAYIDHLQKILPIGMDGMWGISNVP